MVNLGRFVPGIAMACWALCAVCGAGASYAAENPAAPLTDPDCASRMVKPDSFTGLLLYATVRIETLDGDDRDSGDGTGFFFDFPYGEGGRITTVITSRHVAEGVSLGRFILHRQAEDKSGPSGEVVPVEVDRFWEKCIPHPDPDVDLCAMLFQPIRTLAKEMDVRLFTVTLGSDLIRSDEELFTLQAVEDVLMVGYPIGLYDQMHNYPLFRKGITASHPAIDFGGKPVTVIDMACFPGSSGSPVLLADGRIKGNSPGRDPVLLGVLFGAPHYTRTGEIAVRSIPTRTAPTVSTPVMINLGYLVKAREILTLGKHVIKTLEP